MTREELEKQAGIWNTLTSAGGELIGAAGRTARKILTAPVVEPLKAAGSVLQRGATESPGSFLMAAGMGVPMVAMTANPFKNPETLARGYAGQQLVANTIPGTAMKLASSIVSQEDVADALRIREQLEKSANVFTRMGSVVADHVPSMRKARLGESLDAVTTESGAKGLSDAFDAYNHRVGVRAAGVLGAGAVAAGASGLGAVAYSRRGEQTKTAGIMGRIEDFGQSIVHGNERLFKMRQTEGLKAYMNAKSGAGVESMNKAMRANSDYDDMFHRRVGGAAIAAPIVAGAAVAAPVAAYATRQPTTKVAGVMGYVDNLGRIITDNSGKLRTARSDRAYDAYKAAKKGLGLGSLKAPRKAQDTSIQRFNRGVGGASVGAAAGSLGLAFGAGRMSKTKTAMSFESKAALGAIAVGAPTLTALVQREMRLKADKEVAAYKRTADARIKNDSIYSDERMDLLRQLKRDPDDDVRVNPANYAKLPDYQRALADINGHHAHVRGTRWEDSDADWIPLGKTEPRRKLQEKLQGKHHAKTAAKNFRLKGLAGQIAKGMKNPQILRDEELLLKIRKLRFEAVEAAKRALRDEELHSKNMRKWSPRQLVAAGLGLGGAAAVVGAGSHAMGYGTGVAQEKVRSFTGGKRYNAMLHEEPSLAEHPMARKYFDVLDRASPYLAGEPLLAAAAVSSMVNTPTLSDNSRVPSVQPRIIQELLNTEGVRQKTRFPMLNNKETSFKDVAMLGG